MPGAANALLIESFSTLSTLGSLFIAYALHRTRLHSSVTFSALFLLQCLKARFPAAWGSSGHRLFISAFMLASKVMCDDTYSNKSWSIVGQGMFALREIKRMEKDTCSYLERQLNIDPAHLKEFEQLIFTLLIFTLLSRLIEQIQYYNSGLMVDRHDKNILYSGPNSASD
ncbi:hypothetical protein QCA50_016128 [Cerrena zonata]|uniref:Cyclin N-terminal domain-containing protein n=1 Tax=Cerrena zonata TaxID=2478898 RepID=A0AAW0FIA4_9APHY